jgi:hypothetical protein
VKFGLWFSIRENNEDIDSSSWDVDLEFHDGGAAAAAAGQPTPFSLWLELGVELFLQSLVMMAP